MANAALGNLPPFEHIKTEQDLHDIEDKLKDVNFYGRYVSIVLLIFIRFGLFICPIDLKLSINLLFSIFEAITSFIQLFFLLLRCRS